MEIWLDTADFGLIETATQMGILHGVTTNPSIIAKSKMAIEEVLEKILALQNGPVTAQVTATDSSKIVEQGVFLNKFSDRIFVKVPVTAEGLKAIHALNNKKIPTMATAVFDPNQVLLAARAGAQYIAPYFSSICESDLSGINEFNSMLKLLKYYQFPAKLIAASLHTAEQVRECFELGADAVTLNPEVFSAFIENHEETLNRVQKFAKDWKTAKISKKIPF